MHRTPTTLATARRAGRALGAAALAAVLAVAGCRSDPDTVLQTDLPQVPGMTPRDTTGLRQEGLRIVGGQFAYKGPIPALTERIEEVKARFEGQGWRLAAETVTGSTAALEFAKDDRRARVELMRNGVQPKMSTAVLRVTVPATARKDAPAAAADAPAATPARP